jgi:hypothetical protein
VPEPEVTEARVADAASAPPTGDDSINANIQRLIATGKDMVEAEVAWAKLKGQSVAAVIRRGMFFVVVAAVSLTVGLSLLLVAAVVALAPFVGWLAATLIVSALAFLAAFLFGLFAKRTFDDLTGEKKR